MSGRPPAPAAWLTPSPRTRHPLRIAVLATSRYPIRQPFAGGLEALVWQLVDRLRDRGHDVTLFAAEGSDEVDPDYAFPAGGWDPSPVARGDRSMPAAAFMRDHHAYLRVLMALSGPLAERFDVIHNHALHHLPVAMAPLLPAPMLTTLHTPPTPWLESAIAATPGHVSRHARFAAVSGFVAWQWSDLLPLPGPDVVLNGVDLTAWPAGPGGGAFLAWSGRIVPEKAPHLAIEAAQRAGMLLVISGPISDPEYFYEAVRPRLGRTAEYAGHLSVPELAQLVGAAAAVLVTPRWDEPYGLVGAEALACGTPVVAFRRGGLPEVLGDAEVGCLVAPDDVEAMAAAVPTVLALDRRAVRAYAERYLSLDRMVSRYERHYHRMTTGAAVGADRTA